MTPAPRVSLKTDTGEVLVGITEKADLPSHSFHVTEVDLSQSPTLTDEDLQALAGLTQMDSLRLGGTGVTRTGLEHLHGLTTLRFLSLGGLPPSDESIAELRKSIPDCRVEHRKGDDSAATDLVHLKAFPKLTWLSLSNTPLTDAPTTARVNTRMTLIRPSAGCSLSLGSLKSTERSMLP